MATDAPCTKNVVNTVTCSYSDAPDYYGASNLFLVTMDLDRPIPPPDFNLQTVEQTESMVRFYSCSGGGEYAVLKRWHPQSFAHLRSCKVGKGNLIQSIVWGFAK